MDPFVCGCSICDSFWRKLSGNKSDPSLLTKQNHARAADTAPLYAATQAKEKHPAILRIGDRVLVKGQHTGTVIASFQFFLMLLQFTFMFRIVTCS